MLTKLTIKSSNKKTGKIPVSMTEENSCPEVCPWKNKGCYAKYGPLGMHWRKLNKIKDKNILNWKQFCTKISDLPIGQLWRHNQAGDLPGNDSKIDTVKMHKLIKANKNKKGFTYTHKPVLKTKYALNNRRIIKSSNKKGFTINLSADSINEVDRLYDLNIGPVTVILPSESKLKLKTFKGRNIIVCPAEYIEAINCSNCKLCALPNRKSIIGFRAHGVTKKSVNEKLKILC